MATETAELIQIEKPGPPAIVAELAPLVVGAKAFAVTDVESHAEALTLVRRFRAGEKGIEAHFADAKKAASDAHKKLVASIASLVGPIAEARSIIDRKAQDYEAQERRKAEDAQRRLQAEARKQEEERAIMAAIEAEEAGNQQESEAILQQPISAPVVTVQPQIAKVAGVSTRTLWSAKVEDVSACLAFLLTRDEWLPLLEKCIPVLETGLRPLAIAQHQALAIPGVKAIEEISRATR